MTSNQIAYKSAVELKRHNLAAETETNRHQTVMEDLQRRSNELEQMKIDTQKEANAINAGHYARMDAETYRSNLAREGENTRTNQANEAIREQANAINAAAVAETSRHQQEMESIQREINASQENLNAALEKQASESAGYYTAQTETETYRRNLIVNQMDATNAEANLKREQTTTESTRQWLNITNSIRNITGATSDIVGLISPLVVGAGGGAASAQNFGQRFFNAANAYLDNQ